MKRPSLTLRLLAATLFLVTTQATRAQTEKMMAGNSGPNAAKRADELLKRFDKNGDGKLDDDERADAKEAMLKEQTDRQMARSAGIPGGLEKFRAQAQALFDKNGDGRLDEEERAAAQKFAEQHQGAMATVDELLRRFDKNGNGKIDPEERDALDTYLTELRSGAGQMRSELLRRFDRNADGKIDDREMTELEKFVRPRVESNPAQLRRYDTNHDGKIDDTEWLAARAAIAQWLNAAGPAALENESPGNGDAEKNPRMDAARERQTKIAPVSRQSPADDHARLQAVADELARRRAMREAAAETSK